METSEFPPVDNTDQYIGDTTIIINETIVQSKHAKSVGSNENLFYSNPAPGDIIYKSFGGIWKKAFATSEDSAEVLAVVQFKVSGTLFNVIFKGRIEFPSFYTLDTGSVYYLNTIDSSATGAGGLVRNGTTKEPDEKFTGVISKPVYIALNNKDAVVVNMRAFTLGVNIAAPPTPPPAPEPSEPPAAPDPPESMVDEEGDGFVIISWE